MGENLKLFDWRIGARIVAILEWITFGVLSFIFVRGAISNTPKVAINKANGDRGEIPFWLYMIEKFAPTILTALAFWFAIELYGGTEKELEIDKALRKCTRWRNVIIILTILRCMCCVQEKEWILLGVSLVSKVACLLVVEMFIRELQMKNVSIPSNQSQTETPA